jgi:hypothetical protein
MGSGGAKSVMVAEESPDFVWSSEELVLQLFLLPHVKVNSNGTMTSEERRRCRHWWWQRNNLRKKFTTQSNTVV